MRIGESQLVYLQLEGCWHFAVGFSLSGEPRAGARCEKVDVSRRKPDAEQLLMVGCQNSELY